MGQMDRQTDAVNAMLNVVGRRHANLARSPTYTCRDIRIVFSQLGPGGDFVPLQSKLLIGYGPKLSVH